ncbi:MAG TPA: hypothetical protein VJ110_00025 [Candidatus Nanoarchaeia archaeon]|nr:hypothetical protein [Candidatus Nanoarchaeia archaeon]
MPLIHLDEPKHSVKVSTRHAKQILKLEPYAIVFEWPREFKFDKSKKWAALKVNLRKHAKEYPHLIGAIKIFEAIEKLRKKSKRVLLFSMDGPVELTSIKGTGGEVNAIWNYLRERFMAKTLSKIKSKYPRAKLVVLCHNYHWKNLKFLLRKPAKSDIRNYYFQNRDVKPFLTNKIIKKYWNKFKV